MKKQVKKIKNREIAPLVIYCSDNETSSFVISRKTKQSKNSPSSRLLDFIAKN